MLVPSMTDEEIRKEIEKDFPILYRKSLYVAAEIKKQNMPLQKKRIIKTFDYVSKNKNNWIYKIDINKKITVLVYLAYFYSDRGLTAIEVFNHSDVLLFFSAHFFKRYNERLHLNIVLPKDLLHKYIDDHVGYLFTTLEKVNDNLESVFGTTPTGVVLGTYHKDLQYVNVNTFITHDMLKGNQLENEKKLREFSAKHLSKMNRADDLNNPPSSS